MRSRLAFIAATSAVVVALLSLAKPSAAKPEYTRKTKKECGFCHPSGGYTLNDAGKYFREHHYSLEGYKPKSN